MADDERCSPITDFDSRNTSTLPTISTTLQLLSAFGNEVKDVTTIASASDADYSRSSTEKLIEEALYRVVIVIVCVVGLVCNIINLLVLSRKSLTATMERLERSAHYGLVGKCFTNITKYTTSFLRIFKLLSHHYLPLVFTALHGMQTRFLPRCMECRRGLTRRFLSVCPSVCQTREL